MADNVTISQGTGTIVAADEIAGIKYQRVKVAVGVDGVATDLAPGQGARAASLPVTLSTEDTALLTSLLTATPVVSGTVAVSNFPATQPVSATALPLPSGAATAANQATAQTSLGSIDTKTPALGQALAGASTPVVLPSAQVTALTPPTSVGVNNFPATQAVTGTFFQATQPVSATALPLPTGAATEASLGTDGATPATIPGTGVRGWLRSIYDKLAGTLTVGGSVSVSNLPGTQPVSGTVAVSNLPATQAVSIATMPSTPVTGTFFQGTQPVSAASLPLPTGAATSAAQTTAQTSLGSIDTKTPALGQALAAASVPVILPAAIITTLTPPAAITGFATDTTLAGINGTDITTPTAMPAGGAGVRGWLSAIWTKINGTLAVTGTFWQATQPVSGTITAQGNDGTTNRTLLTAADGRMVVGGAVADGLAPTGNSVHVSGLDAGGLKRSIKTDTAGVVQIAGAVTVASLPLPASASTEATLAAQSAKLPATLGQKAMAASLAVAIASDQGNLPTKETRSSTGTITSVASSASTGVLLASNAARLGATVYNDSTAILYLALAATASATAYTVQMAASSYYETPYNYTGVISGIWASVNGNARITEAS